MALRDYKKKRNFKESPEPEGGTAAKDTLRFVIQKHRASRLHYDFRLELEGVLKSWAVPKGPSLDPADKRLAMQVEDHPYAYKDFEGIIPKGNYGAGAVIVWDEGTYEPVEEVKGKSKQEKELLKQLKAGSLKIVLHGKKIRGEFALVRTTGMAENAWLLIKHKDTYARQADITLEDKSVISGMTLEKLAHTASGTSAGRKEPLLQPDAPEEKTIGAAEVQRLLKKGRKSAIPAGIAPMLATLTDTPFDNPEWEYEVKWDGYRAIASVKDGKASLWSRNGGKFDERFYPVHAAVSQWGINAVVDGEIVVVNDQGVADFNALQKWQHPADGKIRYYVFDLLWLEGHDVRNLPLKERKAVLQTLVPEDGLIRTGITVKGRGLDFFDACTKMGLEGILAKRSDSLYQSGSRSGDWLKIKGRKRQEVVIGGYTLIEGSPRLFSSLLVGVYENEQLRYAGKVGTGFRQSDQQEMMELFGPLRRSSGPFSRVPAPQKTFRLPKTTVVWLAPRLVCEIHFAAITADGIFRHPVFIGLRDDKDAGNVAVEKEVPVEQTDAKAGRKPGGNGSAKSGEMLLSGKEGTRVVNGHSLKFTNLDKVLWPAEGYTKRDIIRYYHQVAGYMLPYLKNRPQSLNRFPDGIGAPGFYQKDVTGKVPDWITKYPYTVKGERKRKHYMLCNNEAALLYMVNLGVIDLNPWSSSVHSPDQPDWCILDLDPDTGNTFEQVVQTARVIHDILAALKVPSCCKTSGSTGLHIYIPLAAKYTYEQSQLFARWIAVNAAGQLDFTSTERMTGKRRGKVYIDYLQNRPAATVAAPYSLRPKPGATVSMPLHWEEVGRNLRMEDFNIENAFARLKSEGDLFKPVLGRGINLKKIISNLPDL